MVMAFKHAMIISDDLQVNIDTKQFTENAPSRLTGVVPPNKQSWVLTPLIRVHSPTWYESNPETYEIMTYP